MNKENINPPSCMARAGLAWRLFALSLVFALAACATSPATDEDPVDRVVERAEARWQAILSNDLETAYTYYSPGYRSTVSVIDFGVSFKLRRVGYTSAEYLDRECENQRCVLRFMVGYAVVKPAPGVDVFENKSIHEEVWVYIDDEWWFLPKK